MVQAQERAATLLRDTQSQVDELQASTEASSAERVVEVELLVANAAQEARVESERILADAVADGEAIIARAKDEGRALLEQVQEARRRVLADLAARRRALGIQIEQLRAARDEMTASVQGVRDRVDGILTHLDRTDEEARAAAQAVGDQFRLQGAAEAPHDQDAGDDVPGDHPLTGTGSADTGAEPETEDDQAAGAAPSVDELFARIRAGSESDAPAPEAEAGEGGGRAPVEAAAHPTAGDVEAVPGPDDEVIGRRDEVLAPVTARLSRTVKRALGDDQNRLLDQLRNKPSLGVDDLLGSEQEHLAVFTSAARGHLEEAFTAGTAFAGEKGTVPDEGDAVEQSVEGLAHVVVTMLRRQIADGGGELGDRVGGAFREWRGERVERLAGDYATQAFSAGVTAAAADGKLRWVVTSADGCSDCEDNALAGAVSAAETFPTGHAHPPAHSGCRCLVAPADD